MRNSYYALSAFVLLALLTSFGNAQVVANNDDFLVNENEPYTDSFIYNDQLPAGQTPVYSIIEGPQFGTINLQSNGTFTYNPPLNQYYIRDSVYYQVCVGNACDIAGAEFYVIFRNTSPFAGADYFMVEMNSTRVGNVTANDGDPDSLTDPISTELEWVKLNNPTNGIVTSFDIFGNFTYVPNTGFMGSDSFQYYVVDHCGLYQIATVYLTVTAPNQSPTASNQTVNSLSEDVVYSGSLNALVSDPENDAITYSVFSPSAHGQIALASGGSYTFTPNPNFNGTTSFVFSACDIVGQCANGTITLVVNNVDNDPPTLVDDLKIMNEDSSVSINVSTNDSDDTGTLTYSLFSNASHGNATLLLATGTFSYTPNPNYFGFDSFVIQACDGVNCSNSIVYMQVNGINDAPTGQPYTLVTSEDVAAQGTISFIADPDLTALVFTTPQGNTIQGLTINSDGSYSYNPPLNYSGTQSLTVQGCDAQNSCASGVLTIQVNAVNDLPVVTNKSFTFIEDAVFQGNVSNGNSDVEGSALTYSASGTPVGGSLNLNTDGNFTYTPNANWFGSESIAIQVCDNQGGCSTLQLNLTVSAVNDLPTMSSATFTTNEDVAFTGNLNTLAADIETAALNFTITTPPSNGNLSTSPNGSFSYTPSVNFFGTDIVTVNACDAANACVSATITFNITSVNDVPVAQDRSITMNEDETTTGSLIFSDADHSSLVVSVVQSAQNGQFTINNQGQFSYAPSANFFGSETITLSVCDALSACDAATISFQVNSVQDNPVAANDIAIVVEGNDISGNLSLNDTDGDNDALTYTALNQPSQGAWSLTGNGAFSYTPSTGFLGVESVTYRVCDITNLCDSATLTINVVTANTAPSAINSAFTLTEDTPLSESLTAFLTDAEGGSFIYTTLIAPSHGSIQWLSGNTFIYTPQLNYAGTDNFTYRVCDSGNLCAEASVSLVVSAVNDAPLLNGDALQVEEDSSLNISIATNDIEAEGEAIQYTLTGTASNGTINLTSTGILSYVPFANFFGTESVTYTACDPNNNCTNGILALEVTPVNDVPVAASANYSTDEDTSLNGSLAFYVSDSENDALTYVSNSPSLQINSNGDFSFVPANNFFGEITIDYSVCDAPESCSSASIIFTVNAINDAPLAADDVLNIVEDESVVVALSLNDSDVENESLHYSLMGASTLGEVSLSDDGLMQYIPIANSFGAEVLMINVCDEQGACSTAEVIIEVAPVNDAPIIETIIIQTEEELAIDGSIAELVTDIEGQVLNYLSIGVSSLGEFTLLTDGSYAFVPNMNAFGSEAIAFEVCDSDGACSSGSILLEVSPINDTPQAVSAQITLSEDSATEGNFFDYSTDEDNEELFITITTDVANGTLIYDTTGYFVYAPHAHFFGMDTLHYAVCDGSGACAQSELVFEVTFVNDLPIIVDEGVQLIINENYSGSVATNDIELDFEPLVYTVINDQSGGTFTMNTDGSFIYTPATDTTGLFFVEYSACDPCNACSQGTIQLYVVSPEDANTPPSATSLSTSVCQGSSVVINVYNLVSDAQDASGTLQLSFGTVNSGSYQLDPETQELVYHAGSFASGQVVIPYYVCDNGIISMCDTAALTIDILPASGISITDLDASVVSCFGAADGSIALQAEGLGQLTYTWSNGLEGSAIANLNGGVYSVVISSDEACVASQSAEFTITEPQQLTATSGISDINGDGIGAGDVIELSIDGGFGAYAIDWQTSFGTTGNGTDFIIAQDGGYAYIITDANGCSIEGNVAITSVNSIDAAGLLSIYPNPIGANQQITIQSSKTMEFLSIHDARGRLIASYQPYGNSITVETTSWSTGLYHYAVRVDGRNYTGTIVKQ
ncbi:MAG: Ig-like domain-containing protein [Flavobacteriales bacterium]|jgi:VCBS repeat-containing protein